MAALRTYACEEDDESFTISLTSIIKSFFIYFFMPFLSVNGQTVTFTKTMQQADLLLGSAPFFRVLFSASYQWVNSKIAILLLDGREIDSTRKYLNKNGKKLFAREEKRGWL